MQGCSRCRCVLAIGLGIGTIGTVAGSTGLRNLSVEAGVPLLPRVVVALAVLIVWAATVFHIGPNHHTPRRYDLPGAALSAVGWLTVSLGYGWHIQFAGGRNAVLGIAGALLLSMTWFWIVCLILLIGGELNEIIARRAGVVGDSRRLLPEVDPVAELRSALLRNRSEQHDD